MIAPRRGLPEASGRQGQEVHLIRFILLMNAPRGRPPAGCSTTRTRCCSCSCTPPRQAAYSCTTVSTIFSPLMKPYAIPGMI